MNSLQISGSVFATGAIVRGDEQHSSETRPGSARHGTDTPEPPARRSPGDAPRHHGDQQGLSARVLGHGRTEFPRGDAVRRPGPDDQSALARLIVRRAEPRCLPLAYSPRRSSISQQKSSIEDLRDRTQTQVDCHSLIELHASQNVRDEWYRKLLVYDLPAYTEIALDASDEYWDTLCGRVAQIYADVPFPLWGRIPFYPRVMSWLLAEGTRKTADAFSTYAKRNPRGLPVRMVGDRPHFSVELDPLVLGTRP